MHSARLGVALVVVLLATGDTVGASAKEFYAGEPVEQDGMQIVPNYLTGVRTDGDPMHLMMPMNMVHLEADIHATKDEQHGFPPGAWIPYLTIKYRVTRAGTGFVRTGLLGPMTAKDGPHYAHNVLMDGEGTYHLTFVLYPPSGDGFLRHVDAATGVPPWWKPFALNWTFTYPSRVK